MITSSNIELLILEMRKRNIIVDLLDNKNFIYRATFNGHIEYFNNDMDFSIIPSVIKDITNDRWLTKVFLHQINIPYVIGNKIENKNFNYLRNCYYSYNKPVVLKPIKSNDGKDIYLKISSIDKLMFSLERMKNEDVLVEEYVPSKVYRIFLDVNNNYSVLLLEPSYIIGNGIDNIDFLMRKNHIKMDEDIQIHLDFLHLTIYSVIGNNVKLYLKNNTRNGFKTECKDMIHSSIFDICCHIRSLLNTPYLEIDILTNTIYQEQNNTSYKILNISTYIDVEGYMNTISGKRVNVSKYMIDLLFPETKYHDDTLEKNIITL